MSVRVFLRVSSCFPVCVLMLCYAALYYASPHHPYHPSLRHLLQDEEWEKKEEGDAGVLATSSSLFGWMGLGPAASTSSVPAQAEG
jgi:hypothetical protein